MISNKSVKNIVNTYEINTFLVELMLNFPEFQDYILSNVRNYIIKYSPIIEVNEEHAHSYYKEFKNTQDNNEEVLLSIQKGKFYFHHIIISATILNNIEIALLYIKENKIFPKSNLNFLHLVKRAEKWKNSIDKKNSIEGEIETVLTFQNNLKWVKLKDSQAFIRESQLMNNCIKTYFSNFILGSCEIYSLRNENNKPLVSFERNGSFYGQIKGSSNSNPDRYSKEIDSLISFYKLSKKQDTGEYSFNSMNEILPFSHLNEQEQDSFFKESFFDKIFNFFFKFLLE